MTATTGTLTKVTRKARKTGRKFSYEVYRTANGDLWTARLTEAQWVGVVASPVWGDPCDDEEAAIKSAFREWFFNNPQVEEYNRNAERIQAQQKRDSEYSRSGGY